MAKLHELLAVSGNLRTKANELGIDLVKTFETKRHLFEEKRVTFTSNAAGAEPVTEDQKDIQSTIGKELDWFTGIFAKAIDVEYQIEVANTTAKADIVIDDDGTALLRGVPATVLLQLEKRMAALKELVLKIPTLDPAKGFKQDDHREHGIFKAREIQKTRTKKTIRPMVLYEATKEHPAQVKEVSEDIPVGTTLEQEWSALITPATKSDILERCDILLRAAKAARSRANEIEQDVTGYKIGKKLFDFVLQPLKPAASA